MVKRWFIPLAAAALVTGSVAMTAPAMAASAGQHSTTKATAHHLNPGGLFHAAPGRHTETVNGKSISYSTNWSGYAITGGTYSTTTATWTQPAASCSRGDGETDMSPWVGIDGYSSDTVEQTGTSADCDGSSVDYYAWYEMYPQNYVTINHTVKAGDVFTGTVTHNSGSSYTLTLKDVTENWTNTVTKSLSGTKNNSAEAVLEMAANNLTKFSTDPFSSFTVNGSAAGTAGTVNQMEISTSGGSSGVCDSTSSLSSNENFTVTWLNAC